MPPNTFMATRAISRFVSFRPDLCLKIIDMTGNKADGIHHDIDFIITYHLEKLSGTIVTADPDESG